APRGEVRSPVYPSQWRVTAPRRDADPGFPASVKRAPSATIYAFPWPQDPTMIEPRDRVRHPALLVVDMQNDFVRVGAALEVTDARATIPANKALIDFFRARKLPVVYT